jgi:hypothetical protein
LETLPQRGLSRDLDVNNRVCRRRKEPTTPDHKTDRGMKQGDSASDSAPRTASLSARQIFCDSI